MAGRVGRPLHCSGSPTSQSTRCLLTATENFDRRQSFVALSFEPEGVGVGPVKLVGKSISHVSDGLPKYLRQGSSNHTGLAKLKPRNSVTQPCQTHDMQKLATVASSNTQYPLRSLFLSFSWLSPTGTAIFCAVDVRSVNGCILQFVSVHCTIQHCLPHTIVSRLIPTD